VDITKADWQAKGVSDSAYLQKPFEIERFVEQVSQIISQQSPTVDGRQAY